MRKKYDPSLILQSLNAGEHLKEMAKIYGVTEKAIRKWMKAHHEEEYNAVIQKRRNNRVTQYDPALILKTIKDGGDLKDVAKKYNSRESSISAWMIRNHKEEYNKAMESKKPAYDADIITAMMVDENKSLETVGKHYGVSREAIRMWMLKHHPEQYQRIHDAQAEIMAEEMTRVAYDEEIEVARARNILNALQFRLSRRHSNLYGDRVQQEVTHTGPTQPLINITLSNQSIRDVIDVPATGENEGENEAFRLESGGKGLKSADFPKKRKK